MTTQITQLNTGIAILLFVLAAAAVYGVFVLVWLRDARRSDRQESDPERLHQEPTHELSDDLPNPRSE